MTIERLKADVQELRLADGISLNDFQARAAAEVLDAIKGPTGDLPHEVALTAPTGAGKTYIAGAVMKQLLDNDPSAAAIWASYDPQLNVRSRTDFGHVFKLEFHPIEYTDPHIACGLNVLDLSKLGANPDQS